MSDSTLVDTLKRLFRKSQQTTWAYCPGCREDLVSQTGGSYRDDTENGCTDVTYVCGRCGVESVWHFDAPAPILLSYSGGAS